VLALDSQLCIPPRGSLLPPRGSLLTHPSAFYPAGQELTQEQEHLPHASALLQAAVEAGAAWLQAAGGAAVAPWLPAQRVTRRKQASAAPKAGGYGARHAAGWSLQRAMLCYAMLACYAMPIQCTASTSSWCLPPMPQGW